MVRSPKKEIIAEEETKTSEIFNIENPQQTNPASIYRGKWFSNREDKMIVELLEDGTFRATSWLTKGTYILSDENQIILTDEKLGEITFNLETRNGRTIMHTIFKKEEFLLFPTEELMDEVLQEQTVQEAAVENLVYKKWLDILVQGNWQKQSRGINYTIDFDQNSYVQNKIVGSSDTETHEEKFTIISQEVEEDNCVFVLALHGENRKEIQFKIVESELTFDLIASPGSFLWNNQFEILSSTVELTQDGTQKKEAEKIPLDSGDEDKLNTMEE
ncbi:hypothetical protein [Enterococcus mundtii]|uniref:hypothetical protein n=1 Tax=Enterococcus mundtii TaxID=53346 RepID=UPI000A33B4F4|nr:hypothetical protein [Enterococcus mundtii]